MSGCSVAALMYVSVCFAVWWWMSKLSHSPSPSARHHFPLPGSVEKVNSGLLLCTIAALCVWAFDGFLANLTCQNRKMTVQSHLTGTKKVCSPCPARRLLGYVWDSRIWSELLHSYLSVAGLSPRMSLLFCSCDLGAQGASRAQAGGLYVDTALCLCWLHLSSSCCVGGTPLESSPSSISSSLFSSCWTNPFNPTPSPHILNHSSSSLSQLQLCILLLVHLFPPSLHPSSINSLSLLSLSDPSRLITLFPWLFWQPSVELIHELVLGQCNQPLFVAHYQLPGAELLTAGQWPFVVWSCSLAQRRGSENKWWGSWAYTSMYIHNREREAEKITGDSHYYSTAGSLLI